jgi:hypothetical protein
VNLDTLAIGKLYADIPNEFKMNDLTFDIHALVDGKKFGFTITLPESVKDVTRLQASLIVRLFQPNAVSIEITQVACLY